MNPEKESPRVQAQEQELPERLRALPQVGRLVLQEVLPPLRRHRPAHLPDLRWSGVSPMTRLRRVLLAAVAAVALTGAAAPSGCQDPAPAPPEGASDMIVGASLLRSSTAAGASYPGAYVIARSGATIDSVHADIAAQADAGRIRRLIITDFAINHALNGWDESDRLAYFAAMWRFPGCVVVASVTYTPGLPAGREVDEANGALARLVEQRQEAGYPTRLAHSWRDAVTVDPGLIQGPSDYIHFNPSRVPDATAAYVGAVQSARGAC